MRKTLTEDSSFPSALIFHKQSSHSLSTEQSPRECNSSSVPSKEKSQLCKKFIENGCCPYKNRCKFAHGLHELKKNQQQNSKYKTKYCGGFSQEGFCSFGNRCNFIHSNTVQVGMVRDRHIEPEMMMIKCSAHKNSRLMKLLQ